MKIFAAYNPKKDTIMAQAVPVIRREELFFGGGVRESLNESPLDTFRLKVPADVATTDKLTFSFRSPASGLLCHPLAWIEAKFDIKAPGLISLATQSSAGICSGTCSANGVLNRAPHQERRIEDRQVRKVPLMCFADGDGGFGGAIDHISVVLNGSSFTMNSCDKFWNSLVKTQISSKDAARRYAKCGGAYDQGDARGTKVFTKNAELPAGRNVNSGYGYGITTDSGVAERCRAFYSCIESVKAGTNGGGTAVSRPTYRCKVRWPVNCPPFNCFYGIQDMHVLSPWAQQPLGLSGINQVQLSILFKNLTASLFRDLTDRAIPGFDHCTTGINDNAFEVSLVDKETYMYVKYYRLQSHRAVPAVQSISTFKMMVSSSDKFPTIAAPTAGVAVNADGALFEGTNRAYLQASGRDLVAVGADNVDGSNLINGGPGGAGNRALFRTIAPLGKYFTAEINNISYPQLPQFLMFVFQKSVDVYSHKLITSDNEKGLRPILNRSSNASIRKLYLQLQTSEHVYSFSSDKTAEMDQQVLYEDSVRNCCRDYFGYENWQRSECCLLLSSDTYCPLGLSPGTIMPVQISVRAEIENKNVSLSATNPVGGTAQHNTGAHVTSRQEISLGADRIQGELLMIALYTRGVATISPSSCVLSTMAISQAQASEIISRNP